MATDRSDKKKKKKKKTETYLLSGSFLASAYPRPVLWGAKSRVLKMRELFPFHIPLRAVS
jgi:hypothetical protein